VADDRIPDLSMPNLGRLAVGMTTDQVEAIIGPYLRPNVRRGRKFYAWIGEGAMLRARFDGPGGTLSHQVIDWPGPPYQQVLELGQQGPA
jgi:hypothetical protein